MRPMKNLYRNTNKGQHAYRVVVSWKVPVSSYFLVCHRGLFLFYKLSCDETHIRKYEVIKFNVKFTTLLFGLGKSLKKNICVTRKSFLYSRQILKIKSCLGIYQSVNVTFVEDFGCMTVVSCSTAINRAWLSAQSVRPSWVRNENHP